MLQQLSDNYPGTRTYEQFGISADKLPSYIPSRVAEKILFVGESVQMFETNTPGTRYKQKGQQVVNNNLCLAPDQGHSR